MPPHYQRLLIATFNFFNKSKTTNIIILHENHRIIKKHEVITNALKKYFTDLSKTVKLKKLSPAQNKEPPEHLLKNLNHPNLSTNCRSILMAKKMLFTSNLAR